jgi:methyl-accepting chemotaxis protein
MINKNVNGFQVETNTKVNRLRKKMQDMKEKVKLLKKDQTEILEMKNLINQILKKFS